MRLRRRSICRRRGSIQPPQLITFSFDDLPLATYSISGSSAADIALAAQPATDTPVEQSAANQTPTDRRGDSGCPEYPRRSRAAAACSVCSASFFGMELEHRRRSAQPATARNLPQQFGSSHPSAAQFFNFLILLSDPSQLPAGAPSHSDPWRRRRLDSARSRPMRSSSSPNTTRLS